MTAVEKPTRIGGVKSHEGGNIPIYTMTTRTELLDRATSLLEAGATDEAISLLRDAAGKGWAEACLELAQIERGRGNAVAAQAHVKEAEAIASTGDAFANFVCYLAFEGLFGEEDWDDQERKAKSYLRKAAELGLSSAQIILASHLLWGSNGTTQDEAEYYRWITAAMKEDGRAILAHVGNMMKLGRPVEDEIRMDLERMATSHEGARRMLRKLRLFEKLRRPQ